jgi:GNAT superfamily N-acetyltransferase
MRITALTEPGAGASAYRLAWLAEDDDGMPIGSAYLRVFTMPGAEHRAELTLAVHPAERRRGVGTRLLATAAQAARDLGRTVLLVGPTETGSAFLDAAGLRRVLTLTFTRRPLTDVPGPAEPVPGYRLVEWTGVVPDELAATFAASRRAMDDMPMDDADFGVETWDADRVRAVARIVADRGDVLETVAVVAGPDGPIAGFTELVVPGAGTGDAQHYGTGVLPEHRGRGLARWMKIAMIRRAHERHPGLAGLLADTADSNTAMRRINDELGYRPTHRATLHQLDLA